MIRRLAFAGLLVLASIPPLSAAEKPYVTPAELDIAAFLPPPVAPGSPADLAQQATVLSVQEQATPERIELAKADVEETVYDMYSRTLGPAFNAPALPSVTHLFARVGESEDAVVDPAKPFFGRVRPFLANPAIKALVKPSKSGAYPSGHTTRVAAVATILVMMIPEKRGAIWSRAAEYAQSRVVGGMHYPEDIEAGWRAGAALAAAILAQPDFKADFPSAKAELRGALSLPN
jgi:acid phosphatase (class A)